MALSVLSLMAGLFVLTLFLAPPLDGGEADSVDDIARLQAPEKSDFGFSTLWGPKVTFGAIASAGNVVVASGSPPDAWGGATVSDQLVRSFGDPSFESRQPGVGRGFGLGSGVARLPGWSRGGVFLSNGALLSAVGGVDLSAGSNARALLMEDSKNGGVLGVDGSGVASIKQAWWDCI